MTLGSLRPGQRARITAVAENALSTQLGEMGILAGQDVELVHVAPFGDPLAFRILDYELCLRRAEACLVFVEPLE
ncbi:MAG: ferrous iron transport protein A [Spirochaetales bacterium]|nr:ferrous iron transport protein A [Spirochaetales bacterium]